MEILEGRNHTLVTMNYLVASALVALAVVQVYGKEEGVVRTLPSPAKTRVLSSAEMASLKKPPTIDSIPKGTVPQQLSSSSKSAITSQIIGGSVTVRGAIPYQCVILQDNAYLCGGSLISNQWVLTAAHCAQGRTEFRVTLGAQDRSVFEAGRVTFDTTVKIVHAQYNATAISNDIALLKLPVTVTLPNTYWAVIRLPKQSQASTTFEGLIGLASGWGKNSDAATSSPNLMSNVNMPIISNTACATNYNPGAILSSNICTSTTGNKTICQGDSGGPLCVKESDNIYTLVGVSSFVSGLGCEAGRPAVFVRVTSYLGWISSNTGIAITP